MTRAASTFALSPSRHAISAPDAVSPCPEAPDDHSRARPSWPRSRPALGSARLFGRLGRLWRFRRWLRRALRSRRRCLGLGRWPAFVGEPIGAAAAHCRTNRRAKPADRRWSARRPQIRTPSVHGDFSLRRHLGRSGLGLKAGPAKTGPCAGSSKNLVCIGLPGASTLKTRQSVICRIGRSGGAFS
jgi:hypothetical protein